MRRAQGLACLAGWVRVQARKQAKRFTVMRRTLMTLTMPVDCSIQRLSLPRRNSSAAQPVRC